MPWSAFTEHLDTSPMILRMKRVLFCGLLVFMVISVGCGDDNADSQRRGTEPVAIRIGGTQISQASVTEHMNVIWPMPEPDGGRRVRPPRFTACVEASAPKTKKQAATARYRCHTIYSAHMAMAIGSLIRKEWFELALKDTGKTLSAAQVRHLYERKVQNLPAEVARRVRATPARRAELEASVLLIEGQRRLATDFGVDINDVLPILARRYSRRTNCAKEWKASQVPECTGALLAQ